MTQPPIEARIAALTPSAMWRCLVIEDELENARYIADGLRVGAGAAAEGHGGVVRAEDEGCGRSGSIVDDSRAVGRRGEAEFGRGGQSNDRRSGRAQAFDDGRIRRLRKRLRRLAPCTQGLAVDRHDVLDITTREADLEEIFLAYYRDEAPGPATGGPPE